MAQAGFRVALSAEVVETSIPAYGWRGFLDHQLRWARTVRDARPGGYVGLIFTHGLAWALLNVLASGLSPLSLWLLGMSFFLRLTLAMAVGAEVLGDRQVLPSLWLLAAARCGGHGRLGGGLRRQHHRLARRAVRPQGWQAEEIGGLANLRSSSVLKASTPSEAKAPLILWGLAARQKSCPFKP